MEVEHICMYCEQFASFMTRTGGLCYFDEMQPVEKEVGMTCDEWHLAEWKQETVPND